MMLHAMTNRSGNGSVVGWKVEGDERTWTPILLLFMLLLFMVVFM